MKSTKRTETVTTTRTYWDCERGHHHMTEYIAQKCIDKGLSTTAKEFGERRYKGIQLWLGGMTFTAIAKKLGVHPGTVGGWRHHYMRAAGDMAAGVSHLEGNLVNAGPRSHQHTIWDDTMTERLKLRDPKEFAAWKESRQGWADWVAELRRDRDVR